MIGAGIGKFMADVAELAEKKITNDIVDISNQSSKEGIRIIIELKRDADVENFTNLLYKKTKLEDTFGVNMLAIDNGRPETLSLKEIMRACADFQFEITTRKYQKSRKALSRLAMLSILSLRSCVVPRTDQWPRTAWLMVLQKESILNQENQKPWLHSFFLQMHRQMPSLI